MAKVTMAYKKKVTPKSVDSFNLILSISHIEDHIDRLFFLSAGYRLSEKRNLEHWISRYAASLRKNPSNKKIRQEYYKLLDKYEKDFGWTNE